MIVLSSNATGSPVGAYRSNRSPGIGDEIRSLLALFLIEIRRGQGFWLLPLMVGPVWLLNAFRTDERVILWARMTVLTLETYVIIGPLAAGLAAWMVDRDRRQQTTGMIGAVPRTPLQRDIVTLGAATFWGLIAYGAMACWFLGRGLLFATWGSPDLGIVLVGGVTVAAHAAIGFLFGRLFPGRFTPLLAAALTYALPIVTETVESTTWLWRFWLASPLGLAEFNEPNVFFGRPDTYVSGSLLWMSGMLGVLWMATALLRSRSVTWWIGLAAAGAIAVAGLNPLLHYAIPTTPGSESMRNGIPLMTRVSYEPACGTGKIVEVCVHPAYAARLDDASERFDRILAPVAGLPGVPTTLEQYSHGQPVHESGQSTFDGFGDASIALAALEAVFPAQGRYGKSDAQQVISLWLVEQARLSYPFQAGDPGIDAATDRFAVLGAEDQRAWLEQHWNALHAGDLTLEDLP